LRLLRRWIGVYLGITLLCRRIILGVVVGSIHRFEVGKVGRVGNWISFYIGGELMVK